MFTDLIWPIFWLIIIWFFRHEIRALLKSIIDISGRSKKISYKGLNVDLGTNLDLPIGSQQHLEEKQQIFMKAYQKAIVTNEEKLIKSQLIDAGFTTDQAVNLLIYHLANTNLMVKLLFVDRLIFDEQIKLLSYLNSQNRVCPESDLVRFYDEWSEKTKDSNFTYELFLSFLIGQNMIIQQIDGYSITLLGKEYLGFLIKLGRSIP